MKKRKQSLFHSAITLLLCVSMLIGTTFAWFTDVVSTGVNVIAVGNLDVELEYLDASGNWQGVTESTELFSKNALWEPGYTEAVYLRVRNQGALALKYQLGVNIASEIGSVNVNGEAFKLSDYIEFGAVEGVQTKYADRAAARAAVTDGKIISTGYTKEGTMEKGAEPQYVALVVYMPETVGNNANYRTGEVQPRIQLGVELVAAQFTSESDSFGTDYDTAAGFPNVALPDSGEADVTVSGGTVSDAVTISGRNVSADVPAGVQVESGTTAMTLSVTEMTGSGSNVTLADNEIMKALDVHVSGVSDSNTTPIAVSLKGFAPTGLNVGNLKLYHVENGSTNAMTYVVSAADFTAHNQFAYDPATGDVILYMATFSEVAVVADTENAWNGDFDISWYNTTDASFTIANADQLAGFGQIVGGMAKDIERDSFTEKTVKLISDVNLGDAEAYNNADLIFYPIGYYNSTGSYEKVSGGSVASNVYSFEGTFDGAGHTIANFYQNSWEMFGDYNSGYTGTPNHYKDAMGLFGYVVNGTVKNLTVENFSSDGEFTPTGAITAYAVNSTFENIALVNCNPRVYNTGNGGIVGIGGNSDDPDTYKLTFTNITIDNTNKITALWGSWDVACGGLVGMFRGDGHVYMTNCHVAAQMDVYNDVCGNYQYYWYRYSGMMVGTNQNMITDDNGYTVPETEKFHAKNCTVHFGSWNDYYYCELVDNSLASYTHDHQFSRLTEVDSVDATKKTVTVSGETTEIPASGRYNYVVVNGEEGTDNATCYHFVDGVVWNHTDAGTETVNGVEVPKEDKQHIYLPFNQLFTGYGWGVKHIPVTDYEENSIRILDRTTADSVVKFEGKVTEVAADMEIKVGNIFNAIDGAEVELRPDTLFVTVTDLNDTDGTATAEFVRNSEKWEDGTLKITGTGKVSITIQDYYFCLPTTITVDVIERQEEEKFEVAFDHDPGTDGNQNYTASYMYRVGNANPVALGSLFEALSGVTVGNVTVTVTSSAENANVSGTYTANTSDWAKGTVQFSGTGPVMVTIDDDAYAIEKTLYLEVVNATNVTAYSGLSNRNSVLLNDITMSSGGSYYLSGATLYGNGFTFDVTKGAYSGTGSISNNYLMCLSNANLDNVQIVGAVYQEYGAMVKDEYNRPAVLSVGNCTITNCYISNCAAPVRVNGGNLEIINSTLKGGNFANLDIRNGHVVLDNVTTINQVNGNDTADGNVVVGLGVVVYYENVLDTTTVVVKNGITQYNHLSKTQAEKYITDSTAKELTAVMYNEGYSEVQYSVDSDTWVNIGILSMTSSVDDDHISDVDGYVDALPSMMGVNGYLHAKKPDAASVAAKAPAYTTAGQGAIAPSYSFDYTTKNYVAKTDGSNDYCYEENGTVKISMDEGDTFNWDTSILTASKNGQTLSYTVSMNGIDYTGKSIAFDTAGDYAVTYTYTDNNNYSVDESGKVTSYEKTYLKTVHITVSVIKAATKHAEFTFGSSNQATEKITVGNKTYISATGVSHDNSTWSYITVDGTKIYYPIVEATIVDKKTAYFNVFKNVVTITDYADGGTGAAVTYNSSTTTMPSGLTVVKGIYKAFADVSSNWSTLNDTALTLSGASNVFKYAGSASASATPTTYSGALCFKSPDVTNPRDEYITMVQYSYTDATNTTYYYYVGYHMAEKGDGSCVTPDTLITLANGNQVRVDSLTGSEQLLVWNMETGKLDSAPILFVDSEAEAKYEIVHLYFSDGSDVKVIAEHGFWDYDLNKYVYLDANAGEYIGHTFAKQNGDKLAKVQLVDVVLETEVTTAWSPVTEGHLCYFVNGMLSMPGGVGGLFNIFDVDPETMRYDFAAMAEDIETYGLFTYEELNAIEPLSREMFEAAGGAYLKVSIGKGNLTMDELVYMINRYTKFFE